MFITFVINISYNEIYAQKSYAINIDVPDKNIETDYLLLGGKSSNGETISVNSYYVELEGHPFIPIMGEVHYTRIPNKCWKEEILKMKSGGVNVICTYVFWNMHEEVAGVFDWTEDKNLRKFISLCQECNMKVIVRLGPFCHGEVRNGGLPDWLYGRPLQIRTNDAEYLKYVDRFYAAIAEQLKAFYYKDGGCIIGIQLENELQHSAASWAIRYPEQPIDYTIPDYDIHNIKNDELDIQTPEAGNAHMKKLKDIAFSHGIDVPLYTATGWGYAAVIPREVIPVTAAYTYPTWSNNTPSLFYLFRDIHSVPDYSPVRYEGKRYPSFCAEMGIGIQMTYGRRPRIPMEAGEGLVIRSLGSGANGIGYYMYHGGITPQGKSGFFSDEPSGIPKMSYDFQAPIGEYGYTRDSYRALRIIHNFLNDFGDLLAPMGVVLPENSDTITPYNTSTFRYSVRKKGHSGFIFFTNFQDHIECKDLSGISLTLNSVEGNIRYPQQGTMSISKGISAILPFNMDLEGILLKSATVQPLAKLSNSGKIHYFFFSPEGLSPEFIFDEKTLKEKTKRYVPTPGLKSTFKLHSLEGKEVLITTLTREQALNACKLITDNGEKLLITSSDVLQTKNEICFQSVDSIIKSVVFPVTDVVSEDISQVKKSKYYSELIFSKQQFDITPNIEMMSNRRFQVQLPRSIFSSNHKNLSDFVLSIDYVGDTGAAFIDGKMIVDNFYNGGIWQIGLKRYAKLLRNNAIYFYLQPLYKDALCLQDFSERLNLDFSKGNICRLNKIKITPVFSVTLKLKDYETK